MPTYARQGVEQLDMLDLRNSADSEPYASASKSCAGFCLFIKQSIEQ